MTTLADVRTALELSDSEHATFLTSLIDENMVKPYRSIRTASTKRSFDKSEASFPRLGKKVSTMDANELPSKQELQEICMRGLTDTRDYFGNRMFYFAPSGTVKNAENSDDEDAGLNTVRIIYDFEADYEAPGRAISFLSETLEDICKAKFVTPDNYLDSAMTTGTVIPGNTLLPLQHSNEGTITTTLLSGSLTWIIWPPTDHNLEILRTAYENFAEDFDGTKLEITGDLEGGIILQQAEGEGLRIPPFCLTMTFATKTSVLASYSIVTVDNYISMLQRIPLLKAWFKTELDGKQKQTVFIVALLKWLDRLLNGEIHEETGELDETYRLIHTQEGPLFTLLRTWDNIKDDVLEMMGPADAEVMEAIWVDFLTGFVGRQCKLCDKTIRNPQREMRKHFVDQHWRNKKATERIDSMEAIDGMEGDGSDGTVTKPAEAMEDHNDEQIGDEMDVDY